MDPRPRLGVFALIALTALVSAGCGRGGGRAERANPPGPPRAPTTLSAPDTARAGSVRADTTAARDTLVRYRTFPITDDRALRALQQQLGPDSFAVVLELNRVDLEHARQGDTLVVPSAFDLARLSPFPDTLAAARALPKLLIVSARVQAFGAYAAGRLVRWGPTSTGRKEKPTPLGLYHTNWRQRRRISTFNEEWVLNWYLNLGNFDGISLHQFELPGRPASHSCVRLLEDDAAWLYHWADTWKLVPGDPRKVLQHGTPVLVMDEYAFDQRKPWKRLPEDPSATTIVAEEVEAALVRWAAVPAGAAADTLARLRADSLARAGATP